MSSFLLFNNEGMIVMRTFQAPNGNTLTAINDTQADAMINGGMVEVTEESIPAKVPNTCKKCGYVALNKGDFMGHYTKEHPKENK